MDAILHIIFCPKRSLIRSTVLVRFSRTIWWKYFVSKYHYICFSIYLLFLSSYTLVVSCTHLLIQYCTVPLSTPQSIFSHYITLLPYVTLFHQIIYTQTRSLIPVLHNFSYALAFSTLCQVPSRQICWLHNSVYPLISCKIC
jgi:hypothetical protein